MGRPEEKERFQQRRRNHIAKDLRLNKLFHEKVRLKPSDRPQKMTPKNYERFLDESE